MDHSRPASLRILSSIRHDLKAGAEQAQVEGSGRGSIICGRSERPERPVFDNQVLTLPVVGGNDHARMPKVFVCYRREDSADVTGRIYDRLVATYGREQVLKDVDAIPIGVDFRKHLDRMVAECDVFVAVVGPHWGTSRLDAARSNSRRNRLISRSRSSGKSD